MTGPTGRKFTENARRQLKILNGIGGSLWYYHGSLYKVFISEVYKPHCCKLCESSM